MGWYKDIISSLSGLDQIERAENEQSSELEIKRQLLNDMLFEIKMARLNLDLAENYSHNEQAVEHFLLDYAKRHGI